MKKNKLKLNLSLVLLILSCKSEAACSGSCITVDMILSGRVCYTHVSEESQNLVNLMAGEEFWEGEGIVSPVESFKTHFGGNLKWLCEQLSKLEFSMKAYKQGLEEIGGQMTDKIFDNIIEKIRKEFHKNSIKITPKQIKIILDHFESKEKVIPHLTCIECDSADSEPASGSLLSRRASTSDADGSELRGLGNISDSGFLADLEQELRKSAENLREHASDLRNLASDTQAEIAGPVIAAQTLPEAIAGFQNALSGFASDLRDLHEAKKSRKASLEKLLNKVQKLAEDTSSMQLPAESETGQIDILVGKTEKDVHLSLVEGVQVDPKKVQADSITVSSVQIADDQLILILKQIGSDSGSSTEASPAESLLSDSKFVQIKNLMDKLSDRVIEDLPILKEMEKVTKEITELNQEGNLSASYEELGILRQAIQVVSEWKNKRQEEYKNKYDEDHARMPDFWDSPQPLDIAPPKRGTALPITQLEVSNSVTSPTGSSYIEVKDELDNLKADIAVLIKRRPENDKLLVTRLPEGTIQTSIRIQQEFIEERIANLDKMMRDKRIFAIDKKRFSKMKKLFQLFNAQEAERVRQNNSDKFERKPLPEGFQKLPVNPDHDWNNREDLTNVKTDERNKLDEKSDAINQAMMDQIFPRSYEDSLDEKADAINLDPILPGFAEDSKINQPEEKPQGFFGKLYNRLFGK